MGNGVVTLDGKETGDRFCALAKRATTIDIISPFITQPGVAKLLAALKGRRKVTVTILTRAEPADVLSDAVSVDALKQLVDLARNGGERRFEIRRHANVHAKLYMFDNRTAIIGSANLTKPGLEGGNLELCCLVTMKTVVATLKKECVDPWFRAAELLTHDYVELLQGFETQHAHLKRQLDSLRDFGQLASVRTKGTSDDYFLSVRRLLETLRNGPRPASALEGMMRRGHQEARGADDADGQFNASKRMSMLKLLGLIAETDNGIVRGPFADEVSSRDGQRRLWDRLQLAYPDLQRTLALFTDGTTMTYSQLADKLRISDPARRRLYPLANWLVALGFLTRSDRAPYVFSRRDGPRA